MDAAATTTAHGLAQIAYIELKILLVLPPSGCTRGSLQCLHNSRLAYSPFIQPM